MSFLQRSFRRTNINALWPTFCLTVQAQSSFTFLAFSLLGLLLSFAFKPFTTQHRRRGGKKFKKKGIRESHQHQDLWRHPASFMLLMSSLTSNKHLEFPEVFILPHEPLSTANKSHLVSWHFSFAPKFSPLGFPFPLLAQSQSQVPWWKFDEKTARKLFKDSAH